MTEAVGTLSAAAFLAVAGVAFVACGAMLWKQQRRALRWPSTKGYIAEMREYRDDGPWVDIEYRYEVDGLEYHGHRVHLGGTVSRTVQRWANGRKYKPGMTVRVHYDPQDPTIAFLDASPIVGVLSLICGAALAFMGVWVAIDTLFA